MACIADAGLPPAALETAGLRSLIAPYTGFNADPSAPPSLQAHQTRSKTGLTLKDPDFSAARERFRTRLANVLLLDLGILLESELAVMVKARGKAASGGVDAYINVIGVDLSEFVWAHWRAVELYAVRNCVTHNGGVWQQGQINRLVSLQENLATTYTLPVKGAAIHVQMAHLFAFKTAVRTVLQCCSKHLAVEAALPTAPVGKKSKALPSGRRTRRGCFPAILDARPLHGNA